MQFGRYQAVKHQLANTHMRFECTRHPLDRTGLKISDIDLFEWNTAFASVAMAWMKALDTPHDKVSVNGDAMALGHPLGP